ncbi:hypothetical protein [Paenibacillus sp. FSL R7-0333]|uniref:hypothetical protein n=1 Tax=Paenibacillus sp. FSL R7-0333 TaxID=1926587 RepID=UPI00096C839E|nr:hypothetical protein BK146_05380 [Paenibacillus sp. FSL R7-0333]
MKGKKVIVLVIVLIVIFMLGLFTYRLSKENSFSAESANWRVSLTTEGENQSTLSCEYIGSRTDTIKSFKYKLKGARDYFSGSEDGVWENGYKYEKNTINAYELIPDQNNQFKISITLDGDSEELFLTKK